jgi:hypothetical protein
VPFESLVYKLYNLFKWTKDNYNEVRRSEVQKETKKLPKDKSLKLARNHGYTSLEIKLRKKLGFVDSYTDYIPEEFLSFVKQLKEIEPLCAGFYKVMNRVWQDVSTTGLKYMEESQLQDTVSSFMFRSLMYLVNNLGRWDISFDYMDRNSEVNIIASLAIQSWSKWTEGEIDGKKFMGTIIRLKESC